MKRGLRCALIDLNVCCGTQISDKNLPQSGCFLAGMKLSSRHTTGVRGARSLCLMSGVAGVLAAGAMALSAPASAQQARQAPPVADRPDAAAQSFSSTRRAAPKINRYQDTATQRTFVLDRSGEDVLMKFEDDPEVMALQSTTAQRGDAFLRSDSGELMLRVTELGNVISYVGNKDGAPAAPAAAASPLDAPAMTLSLTETVEDLRERLSAMAGHDVTVFGSGAFAQDERWASDALLVTRIGVERSGDAVRDLHSIRMVRMEEPTVTFSDGELVLGVDPAEGYAGRPSSDAIAQAMTE